MRKSRFTESQIVAILKQGDAGVPIRADGAMLRQVIENLTGNAVNFSPSGATVEVRLECQANEARIIISDNGPGIPAAEQEGLFSAFHVPACGPAAANAPPAWA